MNLSELLENTIKQQIESEKTSQIGPLSGSNALVFNDLFFAAQSSSHCPRIALLRRVGDIQEPKEIKSYISNNHGRLFEDLLRTIMSLNPSIEFKEEEDALIEFKDSNDHLLLTARPDKLMRVDGKIFPIEVKTIQSNNTAYQVFIKNRPTLDALIQLSIYMYGHDCDEGYILYAASNWFGGFAGKTRWKVEPSFKIFTVKRKEDELYIDDKCTIVNLEFLMKGCLKFDEFKSTNELPPRPIWVDVYGEPAKYTGCEYCFAKEKCDQFDGDNNRNLTEFFNSFKGDTNDITAQRGTISDEDL